MEAKLTVVGGKANKRDVTLQVPATIGRSRDADLTVGHRMISRKHCETYLVDGLVMIRDVGSLNGTFVRGKRIREAPLPPGEKFSIGPVTFQINYEYSGDRTKLPPIVPAESPPTEEIRPGKPAEAAASEPAKRSANSRPKKAAAAQPEAPESAKPAPSPAAPTKPKPAPAPKPEPAPAATDANEEPDFQLADDDFELAELPKATSAKQEPAKATNAKQEPPKKKPAAEQGKAAKDPEDQLLDDFLNDLQ
jgi:pSer/pThr/pTyr-binding forkhead associated (FHA) protein